MELLLHISAVLFYFGAVNYVVLLPHTSIYPPTPTEDGVPYIVSIFAENSVGNGTKCNVTDFTNELGTFHCYTDQSNYYLVSHACMY